MAKPSEPTLTTYRNNSTGFWHVNVYWSDTGRRLRPSLKVRDEADVQAAFEAWKKTQLPRYVANYAANPPTPKERPKPEPAAKGDPRIVDLLAWYLDVHCPHRLEPRSLQRYRQVLEDLAMFLKGRNVGRVSQMSLRVVQEWQIWMDDFRPARHKNGRSSKLRRDQMSIVRGMLNAAVRAGEIKVSPVQYWDMPKKGKRKQKALTEDERKEALRALKEHAPEVYNLCLFLAYSGWRVSDVIDFRWGEANLKERFVDREQIKTKDDLMYPLGPVLMRCLQTERKRIEGDPGRNEHVFHNPEGLNWTYNAVYRRMTRGLEEAGFTKKCTPHVFRTTFGTLMANGDPPTPPKVLQNLMGHRDLKITLEFYTEVSLRDLAKWQARAEASAEKD
jgi:integrase